MIERVEHVEEILTVGQTALGKLPWEVRHDIACFLHHRPYVHDGQLVIERDIAKAHVFQRKELLFSGKDRLQKVLVADGFRRHIKLN